MGMYEHVVLGLQLESWSLVVRLALLTASVPTHVHACV